jgi:hypothetical protein
MSRSGLVLRISSGRRLQEEAMSNRGACILTLGLTWLVPLASAAQTPSKVYAGGSLGAFSVTADAVSGKALAAGAVVGVALKPWLDIEGEIARPADEFRRSYTGVSVSFAPPGSSRAEIERLGVVTRFEISRHVESTLSAVAVFHPPLAGRVTPALVVGVTNHRVAHHRTDTPIAIPDGIDPNHPSVRARTERSTRNIGGPTFGGSLGIAMTRHVIVMPDIRFDYGSIGDEINNTLRTSLRVLWRF